MTPGEPAYRVGDKDEGAIVLEDGMVRGAKEKP